MRASEGECVCMWLRAGVGRLVRVDAGCPLRREWLQHVRVDVGVSRSCREHYKQWFEEDVRKGLVTGDLFVRIHASLAVVLKVLREG